MASITKVGYWAGLGTAESPFLPDYAGRYAVTGFHVRDSCRAPGGVCYATYEGETGVISDIEADSGIIPEAAQLPTPAANTLTMPADPLDLLSALAAIAPGDTLELPQGIYTINTDSETTFGTGTSEQRVTIKAASGARVVITGHDGGPPNLLFWDYTTIENIWFAGGYDINTIGCEMGHNVIISGCLFAGYTQAISEGAGYENTISNCVFLHCGKWSLDHAIYIAGDDSPSGQYHGSVVENSLFIACPSYAISLYHKPTHCIVQFNFLAGCTACVCDDGFDHQLIGNILWSNTSSTSILPFGIRGVISNNIFGAGCPIPSIAWDASCEVASNVYIKKTAHSQDILPFLIDYGAIEEMCGNTYVKIEAAIAALSAAFENINSDLYIDGTVDYYLLILFDVITSYKASSS